MSSISNEGDVSIVVRHSNADDLSATVVKDTIVLLPTITSSPDIDFANLASYTVSGGCESGATLAVAVGGIPPTGAVTCAGAGDGSWTATFDVTAVTVTDGTVTISATQTDGVGNTSGAATRDVQADKKHRLAFTSDPANINVATGATYTLSGTCTHEGNAVTATVGGVSSTGTGTVACTSGEWTASFTVSSISNEGTVNISVGHSNAISLSDTVEKDTVDPALPTITSPPNIDVTNLASYTVSGGCESGATVTVTVGGPPTTGAVTCAGAGTWTATLDVTAVTTGTVTISATQTDGLGNTSGAATHDVQANIQHQLAFNSGHPANINIATGDTYTLSGTCSHENSDVTATVGSASSTSTVTCTDGAWTVSFNGE